MAIPTSQEQDQLKLFRPRIADLQLEENQLHDQHLLRWIRSQGMDLSKAEEMLRSHVQWRKANDIGPSLLAWLPPPFIAETYTVKLSGYDKVGSPILLVPFGNYDLRPALARGEKENVIRYQAQVFEKVMKLMELYEVQRQHHPQILSTSPEKISQFCCICDWTGFSMWSVMSREVVQVILEVVRSFQANYPETLKAAYNVNCPKVFDMLFKLVKPFLSERTLSKISIYDTDEARWKSEIMKGLPPEQVLQRYGGTRTKVWDLSKINLDLNQDGTFFQEVFNVEHHDSSPRDFIMVDDPSGEKLAVPVPVARSQTTSDVKLNE